MKKPTSEPTRQRQMMTVTTSPPSPEYRPPPSIPQTCDRCARALLGASASGWTSTRWNSKICLSTTASVLTVTYSLNHERLVFTQALFFKRLLEPSLRSDTHFRTGPVNFQLEVIDWTHGWSDTVTEQITHTDLLAVIAAVHISVKLHFTSQQR